MRPISDAFAAADFGKVFGLFALAPATATLLFNNVAARFYEDAIGSAAIIANGIAASGAAAQGDGGDGGEGGGVVACIGRSCYSSALVFSSCMALLGTVCGLLLIKHTAYSENALARARAAAAAAATALPRSRGSSPGRSVGGVAGMATSLGERIRSSAGRRGYKDLRHETREREL